MRILQVHLETLRKLRYEAAQPFYIQAASDANLPDVARAIDADARRQLAHEASIHFDHLLAAVFGIADQPSTDRIDDEIQ